MCVCAFYQCVYTLHITIEKKKFTDLFTGSIGNVTKDIGYLSAIGTKTSISVHMCTVCSQYILQSTIQTKRKTNVINFPLFLFRLERSAQQLCSSTVHCRSVFLFRCSATTIGYGSLNRTLNRFSSSFIFFYLHWHFLSHSLITLAHAPFTPFAPKFRLFGTRIYVYIVTSAAH